MERILIINLFLYYKRKYENSLFLIFYRFKFKLFFFGLNDRLGIVIYGKI